MNVGLIGIGNMGRGLAQWWLKKRWLHRKYKVIGYDQNVAARKEIEKLGGVAVSSIAAVAEHTTIIWLMVPAGKPVDEVIGQLMPVLKSGSIIIDGGNSKYTDSIARAELLAAKNIFFLDCGTSGGLRGAHCGYSFTVGGDYQAFEQVEDLFFRASACGKKSYAYVGPSGAGHYVKMIHNGLEYGIVQAYAEGLHLLKDGFYKDLDLAKVTKCWNHGAIIKSPILKTFQQILKHGYDFQKISGSVGETGMGRWSVETAQEFKIPTPVIKDALDVRLHSHKTGGNFATKLIALWRHIIGGHPIEKIKGR